MKINISGFIFDIQESNLESMKRSISYDWDEESKNGEFKKITAAGKYTEEVEFTGSLIMNPTGIDKLEEMANEMKPVKVIYQESTKNSQGIGFNAVIVSIDRTLEHFYKNHLQAAKVAYTIKLKRKFA